MQIYRMPSDVLHYEIRMFLGLTAQDMMIIGVAIIGGIQGLGLWAGAFLGTGAFLALKRYESLGNRSFVVYGALWLWHRFRPQQVLMPRVLPQGSEDGYSVILEDWQGNTVMEME